MASYDDKALLFITSTDARVPQGRNARAQHRSKAIARAGFATKGQFCTLDFRIADNNEERHARKRQRRLERPTKQAPALRDGEEVICTMPEDIRQSAGAIKSIDFGWSLPFLNPAEILSAATFHVRRMAVMSMDPEPNSISNLLRRRQWSCVPFASNCFGKDPCVDSAVLCVADRIRFLSGSPFSPILMMKHYDKALRELRAALDEPEKHHPQDVLAAIQLLAVYEMLDSGENGTWSKHIEGASLMIQAYTVMTPEAYAKWESRGCGHALPMFGDALMNDDTTFFRTYPWRELLWAIFSTVPDPPEGIQDLMQCLRLMPGLLLDVEAALKLGSKPSNDTRFALLDRAHDLRYRITSALGGNQMYTSCNYREMLTKFDLLGTFLSGLVAMDRIIGVLTPSRMPLPSTETDETGEICAQLLQLELGAMVQYPPTEVLAGFQHAAML